MQIIGLKILDLGSTPTQQVHNTLEQFQTTLEKYQTTFGQHCLNAFVHWLMLKSGSSVVHRLRNFMSTLRCKASAQCSKINQQKTLQTEYKFTPSQHSVQHMPVCRSSLSVKVFPGRRSISKQILLLVDIVQNSSFPACRLCSIKFISRRLF